MGPYRFDPYTGQPLPQSRPGNNRAWLGGGYQYGSSSQPPEQPPQKSQEAQAQQPSVIFRLVASYDEAKAVPTDFSGALTIMPDWAHGYIYAKALGDDGNPLFRAYRYEPPDAPPAAEPTPAVAYAPLEELERLRQEINGLREELAAGKTPAKDTADKPTGKGSKA